MSANFRRTVQGHYFIPNNLIHDLNFDKNRTLLPVMNLSFVTDLNLFALKVSIL